MVNKLIAAPLFIIALLVLFGVASSLSVNPSATESGTITVNGSFVESGDISKFWYYIYPGTGHYYRIEGQGADLGTTFNPSEPANQDKSFRLTNTDTNNYEYYDNYEEFLNKYGSEAGVKKTLVDDLFDTNALWLAVVAILGVSIVLGVKVFGSGLSEWSQKMILVAAGYGILWAFLSLGAYDLLIDSVLGVFGSMIYIILTLTFIVGVIGETSGGG